MVSWIIIGRNWERNYNQLFDCIRKQTAPKDQYEIIFVDDSSSDNSYEILKIYAKANNFTALKTKSNRGRGAARNLGINKAKGKWCIFTNSNTYPTSNFISNYLKRINDSDCDILAGRIDYSCPQDKAFELYLNHEKRGVNQVKDDNPVPIKFILFGNCAIKKIYLSKFQFDESIFLYGGEELELLLRITKKEKVKALKVNSTVLREQYPSLNNHCERMVEFGYNLNHYYDKKLVQRIIPRKILFVLKYVPITKLIYMLNKVYYILPHRHVIKVIVGLHIIKGVYSKKYYKSYCPEFKSSDVATSHSESL